jgi:glycosyltransferase involved in cell wall biosynthesis
VNVAFVQATLGVGGAERLVQSLLTRFDPARVNAFAINLYDRGPIGDQLSAAGVSVEYGLAAGAWDPAVGRRLARRLAERRVDVVHVTDSAMPQFWAGLCRRFSPVPRLVLGFHSTGTRGDVLQRRLANACAFPVADRLVALAASHRDFLCGRFGLSPDRFTVIANGVDVSRFTPAPDRARARRAVGLDADTRYVGIVAALRPEKNHALFLEMAARVARRRPAARFLVIGDGPERARLESAARRGALGDRVSFLGTREDVPELLRALDVCVLCSHPVVETFPVTLLEAQASAVPVVSTDVGSIRDVVADGRTGFLVPSGDAEALANRVERLLADENAHRAMAGAARERVTAAFTIEAMVAAYERLFAGVAANGGAARSAAPAARAGS